MRGRLLIALLAAAGVLVAASVGYAAYLASRDSVGLPVTKLDPAPSELAPTVPRRTRPRRTTTTTTATRAATTTDDRGGRTTTGEDHSGRGRGGSGSSGHGGGGGDD
jgi:uncharacterized membrane protein YgcG